MLASLRRMFQNTNYKKLAFGSPSVLTIGFTLFVTYEYFTGFIPSVLEVITFLYLMKPIVLFIIRNITRSDAYFPGHYDFMVAL